MTIRNLGNRNEQNLRPWRYLISGLLVTPLLIQWSRFWSPLDPSIVIIRHHHFVFIKTLYQIHFHGLHSVTLATFLFFVNPFFFSNLFLFLFCFWNDCPTKEGCCFNAKLFATCPKWSFLIINTLFSSPRWAVYARTQEQNAFLACSSISGWKGQAKKIGLWIDKQQRIPYRWKGKIYSRTECLYILCLSACLTYTIKKKEYCKLEISFPHWY